MMYGQLIIVTVADKFTGINVIDIKKEVINIGRSNDNEVVIDNGFVSSSHGYIKNINGALYYVDKDSANGTFFNGRLMRKSDDKNIYPVVLNDGDVLFIGDAQSRNGIYIVYSAFTDDNYHWLSKSLKRSNTLSIGRNRGNDIAIASNSVSANHAQIVNDGSKIVLSDNDSTNGVFVNRNKISGKCVLNDYDKITIDDSRFVLIDKLLLCGIKKEYIGKTPGTVLSTDASKNRNEKTNTARNFIYEYGNEDTSGTLVVLSFENGNVDVKQYEVTDKPIHIGRNIDEVEGNINIDNTLISRDHAVIKKEDGNFWYTEKGLNKFSFNGKQGNFVPLNTKVMLKNGYFFSLGSTAEKTGVLIYFTTDAGANLVWNMYYLQKNGLTIGRGRNNNIYLPLLSVSREHAKIIGHNGQHIIIDTKSANGVFVNNKIVNRQQQLAIGDCIDIVNAKIIFMGDFVIYGIPQNAIEEQSVSIKVKSKQEIPKQEEEYKYSFKGGMNVELENISRKVPCKAGTGINGGNKKYILQDITLRIRAGQLVAILGGSGAGKTTFMNAVNGFEPATSGTVKINGKELYHNYPALKNQIGYVPQQDIIHDELTLKSMLTYVAKLRLQKDLSKTELDSKVDEVIKMVDLSQHANTMIKKLSGGQRKRASIAVELLSDPELFFLDEPTSGLDPEAETQLMKRLVTLAHKKGKTVIVITHTLQNIHLFDKVVFLAPGGKLCFYGSPEDAKKFFEVDNLSDAYEKIGSDINGYVEKFERARKAV